MSLIGGIAVLILVPSLVILLTTPHILNVDVNNQWIGFWGGYLGSIIGSIATIMGVALTLRYQQKKDEEAELEKEKERKERRRLELIPYIKTSYYIPKSEKEFEGKETYYVDFTGDSPVVRNYMDTTTKKMIVKPVDFDKYYILNYRVCNIGTGSAAKLFIKLNDFFAIRNGGLCPNEQIILCCLFYVEDLDRLSIEFSYTDVIDIGKYEQEQVFQFEKSKDQITLKNEKILSTPKKV